jgi:hypothetical protein
MPPFKQNWEGKAHASLRALLDAFSEGAEMSVAEQPFEKPSDTILARVHPVRDEVWDVRCFDPYPGIRVLGRFSECDHFVALTWNYRENMDWPAEIARCKAAWRNIFGDLPPHLGRRIDEYLSFNVRIV